MHLRPALSASVFALALLQATPRLRSADESPWNARDLARKVQLAVEPGYDFRYNTGTGPYSASTEGLFERGRRAFSPRERVSLSFRLPRDARVAAPLETRAAFAVHDLDGTKRQDAGEVALTAASGEVTGRLDWTVPDLKEGSYFLAGRFLDKDGQLLATRSEVVFVTSEYERLVREAGEVKLDLSSLGPLVREVSVPSTEMLVEDARMRWFDFGRAPRDWQFVKRQLETAREHARRLAAGEDPWKDKIGLLVKAYRSDFDDTLQPYGLYVPRDYDAKKPWPLLVSLHGATSNHLLNRRRVFGLGNRPGESDYEAIRNEDVAFPDVGFIVLTPYGRGEVATYNGIAEQDVLRAMADVKRAYNVDEDRVYLTGLSMGGGGTWHLGLRYPDRFAALAPVCAVGDLSLMGSLQGVTEEDRAMLELTGPTAIAENASNQHVFIFHGDADPVVVPEHSRRMASRYRDLGWLDKTVFYYEQPGVHHFAWDFAYRDGSLFERLAKVKRNPSPDRVIYSTYSPRYNQAYWVRIDRIDKGLRIARIEATRRESGFVVKSANLSAFTLLLDAARIPAGAKLEVTIDGKSAWRGAARGKTLSLSRDASGRWTERPWTGPSVGPPDHAEATFLGGTLAQRDPHVYVYGTGGDAAANEAVRKAALKLADWGPNVRARFKVMADSEVTPEIMASRSLVLVGNAAMNRAVAGFAKDLPLRQDGTGTYAGAKRVAGKNAAFRLYYRNPRAAGRYVLVYAGGNGEALGRILPTPGPRPVAPLADYAVVDEDGKVALEGYFKDDWTIAGSPSGPGDAPSGRGAADSHPVRTE
jgi:pimeloyl-ACP methyl ester carboxylesterase